MSTFTRAIAELENSSPVYYRILATDEGPEVVAMQWFDEYDYDQSLFIGDTFDDKGDAEAAARALRNIWRADVAEFNEQVQILLDAYDGR